MANKIPPKVQKKIKQIVYEKAKTVGYLESDRVENGNFIDSLVSDKEVGQVLQEYMKPEDVRTYIKDGIINRIPKDKAKEDYASISAIEIVSRLYDENQEDLAQIDAIKVKSSGKIPIVVSGKTQRVYVVSNGTIIKWETALRKALEISSNRLKNTDKEKVKICLKLSCQGKPLTESEKTFISNSLAFISAKAYFV